MTHYRALLENERLGQWDIPEGKRVTVVIATVKQYVPARRQKKKMPDGSYKDELLNKLLITFRGKRKSWISGPATYNVIASLHGNDWEKWIDKPITLYVDPDVKMKGRKTGGIRVLDVLPKDTATDDALDNAVDPERAAIIADAFDADEEARQ